MVQHPHRHSILSRLLCPYAFTLHLLYTLLQTCAGCTGFEPVYLHIDSVATTPSSPTAHLNICTPYTSRTYHKRFVAFLPTPSDGVMCCASSRSRTYTPMWALRPKRSASTSFAMEAVVGYLGNDPSQPKLLFYRQDRVLNGILTHLVLILNVR